MLNQADAPFFEALAQLSDDGAVFSTPGHKRGQGAPPEVQSLLADALMRDVPHGGGVDTSHISFDVLMQAEALAAEAYGAELVRFLVNGSTTGNIAMLLATCRDGDEVIITRMLHKSLLAGLIVSGATPVYLSPVVDPNVNLPLETTVRSVQAAIDDHPAAKAVVLASPSYVGVTSDLATIASLCHEAGMPLLVDEAWGPHFYFHPDLPASAMQSNADVGVSSTHKMLSSVTQGAILAAKSDLLDVDRLSTIVDMVQTTSPSVWIYGSIDANRRQMMLAGRDLLQRTLELVWRLRGELAEIDGLQVIGTEIIDGRSGVGFDPTRVLVDVHRLGITGYEAEMILRNDHRIFVEMSDLVSVLLLVTIGDTDESINRAVAGFTSLADGRSASRHDVQARSSGALLFSGEQVTSPREAFMAVSEAVPIALANGRVSVENITPYPPGIPVVTPGERLNQEAIEYLQTGLGEGMYISGLSDPSCKTVRVIR